MRNWSLFFASLEIRWFCHLDYFQILRQKCESIVISETYDAGGGGGFIAGTGTGGGGGVVVTALIRLLKNLFSGSGVQVVPLPRIIPTTGTQDTDYSIPSTEMGPGGEIREDADPKNFDKPDPKNFGKPDAICPKPNTTNKPYDPCPDDDKNKKNKVTYYHYTTSPPECFVRGLWADSAATVTPYLAQYDAHQKLGIPIPTLVYPVTLDPKVTPVTPPSIVQRSMRYTGGGIEVFFPQGTPPGSVGKPMPVRKKRIPPLRPPQKKE